MGIYEQNRFVEAARNARSDGGVQTAAHMLSGLAMFDILPALAILDRFSRDRLLGVARTALAQGAFDRIQFAATVVSTLSLPAPPQGLPADQVEDAVLFLVGRLKPANSQAALASYSSMDAAAIQALSEAAPITAAVQRELSGSIYQAKGAFKFTPARPGGLDWSDADVSVPGGTKRVARYHTHPNLRGAENFSLQDMMISRGLKDGSKVLQPPLYSYLATPSRQIKKLTPPAFLKGAELEKFPLVGKVETIR